MKERKKKIPDSLKQFAPFFHDIDLGGNLNTAPNQNRIRNAVNLFFPPLLKFCGGSLKGKRILDIGCNCGGFSFASFRYGASEVIGIDSRKEHIEQANAIKSYLNYKNIHFYTNTIEKISDKYGKFDICILAGIIYHLSNPIDCMRIISRITNELIMIDSHVHYSSNSMNEDIPSWWMLIDTDINDFDGLYENDQELNIKNYKKFEDKNPINYGLLEDNFRYSPFSKRDIDFSLIANKKNQRTLKFDSLCTNDTGSLVMVPNKKALIKLLRFTGFEDIVQIIPHRFSEVRYLMKYRIGLFGIKRNSGKFYKSIWSKQDA